jgi:hypothetical protein
MSPGDQSFGEQLNNAYLNGPGIQLRGFATWARNYGYDTFVGISATPLTLTSAIDPTVLGPLLPPVTGKTVTIQSSKTGYFDFTFWVDQFMVDNYPTLLNTAYTCDFDNLTRLITITLVGGMIVTFTIPPFSSSAQYLYAIYNYITASIAAVPAAATGTPVIVAGGTSGFAVSDTIVLAGGTFTTATVLKVTSVNGIGVITGVSIMTPGVYSVIPSNPVSMNTTSGSGVGIPTFTMSYSTYIAAIPYSWSTLQYLAYEQGSGNTALDALFGTTTDAGFFLPYIPMIVGANNYISATFMPDAYAQVVPAVKRALGASYDKLVTMVQANPDANQIDYAYVVFAVSLNVLENDCRNYIYQFFLEIMTGLSLSSTAFATWQTAWATANTSVSTWALWNVAQSDPTNPLYNTVAPTVIPYPASPGYSVSITSADDSILNYNMVISWDGLNETTGSGVLLNTLGVPANVGDFWFEVVSNVEVSASAFVNSAVGNLSYTKAQTHVRLNWQVGTNNWSCLDIYNLEHNNYIFGGKSVNTMAVDALADTSESGFLIPLSETVYKNMSLVASTQMATACCFIVFNSYTVTTAPWWSAGFFKILLIVVAIAITVATAGATTPGLLGTDLSVGATLGLTGVAAVILGAVVNAIAAIVLVQLINIGATAILGPEIGPIIGTIVGLIALQTSTFIANGMSASQVLNLMMQPMNILKLTEAIGNAFAEAIQLVTQKTILDTNSMLAQYNAADVQVEDQYQAMFGSIDGAADLTLNPLSLIDVSLPNVTPSPIMAESPTDFLSRTLMTGNDICDLSLSFVTDFCAANLSTKLPTST